MILLCQKCLIRNDIVIAIGQHGFNIMLKHAQYLNLIDKERSLRCNILINCLYTKCRSRIFFMYNERMWKLLEKLILNRIPLPIMLVRRFTVVDQGMCNTENTWSDWWDTACWQAWVNFTFFMLSDHRH